VSELGAYFTRGSGHTIEGAYTEYPEEYQAVLDRLARKHTAAAEHTPAPLVDQRAHSPFAIVTLGSCELAVLEAIELLAERGVAADYMRIRGFPFGAGVRAFLEAHERIVVVEQNRDAQLRTLITLETPVPKEKLESVLAYGGYPLSAEDVVDGVTKILGV
jgi:2-oxoglutarate ferredoxin oxidoreductase subunit alpha